MMSPNAHAEESDGHCRPDHGWVTEYRLPGENGNDFGGYCKCWKDEYVNFGMPKDPEKVHPQYGRAACGRVKEMAPKITIDQQHELCCREWTHRHYHEPCHDQIEPRKQRHSSQRHAGTPQTSDARHNIDCTAHAAKPRYKQAQRPEISTVAR